MPLDDLMRRALAAAKETKVLDIAPKALTRVAAMYQAQFGGRRAIIVADPRTFAAAGQAALDQLRSASVPCDQPFLFTDPDLHADYHHVEALQAALAKTEAIPVAVGSGTINDLTKLASSRTGRPYMVVGTAASMDGYTSFGASITYKGSKQTFDCPAPQAVLVDLEVAAGAPEGMNAAGYADLMAKVTGGADWIIADALGEDPIDPTGWELVQSHLREALADPAGVRTGNLAALERLVAGLLVSGFAMQWTRTSRPASGAEHLFSHLWDMQHHTHNGVVPSHGFKVGVATLAVTRLHEQLCDLPLEEIDAERAGGQWPDWPTQAEQIRALYDVPEIAAKALEESQAKYIARGAMVEHLRKVRAAWPDTRQRLRKQLPPAAELAQMLKAVGAPTEPEEIGISRQRLRGSYMRAAWLRRRYTSLDLAVRSGTLERCLARIFM